MVILYSESATNGLFTLKLTNKYAIMQQAVWRNGGSNSAENDVRTRKEVTRLTCSVSRRFAKPPDVVCNLGRDVRC